MGKPSTEVLRLVDDPTFELLFKTYRDPTYKTLRKIVVLSMYLYFRFGFYQHHTGLRVPCLIQLFAHQHEKVVRLHMYDQSGNLQAELDGMLSIYSLIECIREQPCLVEA